MSPCHFSALMPEKLEHLSHKKPSVLIAAASTMALNQKQSNNIQWGVEKQSVTCSNKQTTNQLGGGGADWKGSRGLFRRKRYVCFLVCGLTVLYSSQSSDSYMDEVYCI